MLEFSQRKVLHATGMVFCHLFRLFLAKKTNLDPTQWISSLRQGDLVILGFGFGRLDAHARQEASRSWHCIRSIRWVCMDILPPLWGCVAENFVIAVFANGVLAETVWFESICSLPVNLERRPAMKLCPGIKEAYWIEWTQDSFSPNKG